MLNIMKKMYVTVGISGSGKTTWAESMIDQHWQPSNDWININRDHIRLKVLNDGITWKEYKFNKTNENKVSEMTLDMFNAAVQKGVPNIIISDTNLNEKYRNEWIRRGEDAGYEIEIVDFPITFDEACRRNTHRHNGVSRKVIYQQYQLWNEYIGRKTYNPDQTKPKVILVDIDGTIAERHDRSPFEWMKVGQDKPREFIIDLIKLYWDKKDCEIVFLSGRDAVCRHETLEWIVDHVGLFYTDIKLHMRKEGDMRKDTFVKEEIFWEHIADNYNVIAVFDDRKCVVDMWHEIGLPNVIAVADQNIEF